MGISKALMEKIVVASSRTLRKTTVCLTRYGNVMASRGSVIPLFLSQIKKQVPLTITDGNMTRFLMSLDEAVNLVLFAFNNANSGDLFIHKAPASTIFDLATAIKNITKSNVDTKIIGTRHGEKLFETLCTREEMMKAEDLGEFYRIPADNRDLNYSKYISSGNENPENINDFNSHNAKRLNVKEIEEILKQLPYIRKMYP